MRINIINLTANDLRITDLDASGMKKWRDTVAREIPATEKRMFTVEFGCCCQSGRGHAVYSCGGIERALEIRAFEGQIQVTWSPDIKREKIWTYPAPTSTKWSFKAKTDSSIYSIVLAQLDYLPEQSTDGSREMVRANWMKEFSPVIKDRPIGTLMMAASHDSASYSMANCCCGCFAKT